MPAALLFSLHLAIPPSKHHHKQHRAPPQNECCSLVRIVQPYFTMVLSKSPADVTLHVVETVSHRSCLEDVINVLRVVLRGARVDPICGQARCDRRG